MLKKANSHQRNIYMKGSTAHNITYVQAINEALDLSLKKDRSVFVIGLGVPDPKGIFGATVGLQKKYGGNRVMDMPVSENGITGVCIGAAISGMRPVLTHQRVDFSLLALEQVINNAAKWHYMFGGRQSVPLVIKVTIGMGWGQGAQHSQNLQAVYAHIPGLKVVMPSTPADAKGLMVSAIEDNNPVIYIDHRWLHDTFGQVPSGYYKVPIGKASIVKKGEAITIVSTSHMTIESIKAANLLKKMGINPEIIDVRTLKPLDEQTIFDSVSKTKRLLVADLGYKSFGAAAEIIAAVSENQKVKLLTNPQRITSPDLPTPSTPALAKYYYPRYIDIARKVVKMVGGNRKKLEVLIKEEEKNRITPLDVPDKDFKGPF